MTTALEPVAQLERDIKRAASTLGRDEARFLVDTYYSLQDFRIQSANQVRSIVQAQEKDEPHATLVFFGDQFAMMEKQVQSSLDTYSNSQPLGRWAREHTGVGPVIAAGLLAHIDIEKASSASAIWRYAGLVPGQRKQKGVKRDWNASLKVLAWKLGDSFVKQSGRESCYYGHLYRARKEFEVSRDHRVEQVPEEGWYQLDNVKVKAVEIAGNWFIGGNAEAAAKTLTEKDIRDKETRNTYLSGHLPDGRLDMRARRYAVKRFLAHYFEAAWWLHYGTEPPNPYVKEHLGHVDIEGCPIPMPKP
jgi:transposase IS116/IS110/IS902 family protein